jgi:hypothetical protein
MTKANGALTVPMTLSPELLNAWKNARTKQAARGPAWFPGRALEAIRMARAALDPTTAPRFSYIDDTHEVSTNHFGAVTYQLTKDTGPITLQILVEPEDDYRFEADVDGKQGEGRPDHTTPPLDPHNVESELAEKGKADIFVPAYSYFDTLRDTRRYMAKHARDCHARRSVLDQRDRYNDLMTGEIRHFYVCATAYLGDPEDEIELADDSIGGIEEDYLPDAIDHDYRLIENALDAAREIVKAALADPEHEHHAAVIQTLFPRKDAA